jgi:hypothetical protein
MRIGGKMAVKLWNPRVELTKQEQFIIAQLNRVRKLMPFLRRHRHELLDDKFQEELTAMYVTDRTLAFRANRFEGSEGSEARPRRLSRPFHRGTFRVREVELLANRREAQDLTVDSYDVIDAAGGVAVPAHEFRFPTAKRIPSFRSFLHVRTKHVRPFNDHRNARENRRSM